MQEYISKFSDLVEACIYPNTHRSSKHDSGLKFIEGIMNPYIKNNLRSCKISTLQDIFKFALEEDQKQKIRALDFEGKPDTIAHCDIQAIKGQQLLQMWK